MIQDLPVYTVAVLQNHKFAATVQQRAAENKKALSEKKGVGWSGAANWSFKQRAGFISNLRNVYVNTVMILSKFHVVSKSYGSPFQKQKPQIHRK